MIIPSALPGEVFLQNLTQAIEKHIDDPDLDINKLLRLVGMSRTDLHRKLDKAVGMSATEYLRHVRLQHAAQLLRTEFAWSIYQITNEVGFNSQSYFSRRFKEVFGCCPKKYRAMFLEKSEDRVKLEHTFESLAYM